MLIGTEPYAVYFVWDYLQSPFQGETRLGLDAFSRTSKQVNALTNPVRRDGGTRYALAWGEK